MRFPSARLLGEATTDEQGNCRLRLTGVSSKTHCEAHVIATADGAGLAWQRLAPDVSFTLPAEQVIRGRVVDREGRPAPGVRLSILWVVTTTKNERAPEGVVLRRFPSIRPQRGRSP